MNRKRTKRIRVNGKLGKRKRWARAESSFDDPLTKLNMQLDQLKVKVGRKLIIGVRKQIFDGREKSWMGSQSSGEGQGKAVIGAGCATEGNLLRRTSKSG